MPKPVLSAIVTTKNKEQTIGRCLASLAFTDEIIVVDSGSTDRTLEIAKQHARIIKQSWLGYGAQKNVGADAAQGEWLLFIDADEEITPKLAEEIQRATHRSLPTTHSLYWLRIITIFLGKPLRHLYGHNPRLFKKTAARWNNAPVHEQVVRTAQSGPASPPVAVKLGDADTGLIAEPLLHHSHAAIRSYLQKMHQYTTLDAEQMTAHNRHRSGRPVQPAWHLPLRLAARQLIKLLVYRKGILDGWQGIVWCLLSAYYEYEMGMKYLQQKKLV